MKCIKFYPACDGLPSLWKERRTCCWGFIERKMFWRKECFLEQPSVYTFVAYDRVLLLRVVRDSLEEFIKNNPKNVIDIIKNLA